MNIYSSLDAQIHKNPLNQVHKIRFQLGSTCTHVSLKLGALASLYLDTFSPQSALLKARCTHPRHKERPLCVSPFLLFAFKPYLTHTHRTTEQSPHTYCKSKHVGHMANTHLYEQVKHLLHLHCTCYHWKIASLWCLWVWGVSVGVFITRLSDWFSICVFVLKVLMVQNAAACLHWLHIHVRSDFKVFWLAYKIVNGHAPSCLSDLLRP